jgi:hypothetical protein
MRRRFFGGGGSGNELELQQLAAELQQDGFVVGLGPLDIPPPDETAVFRLTLLAFGAIFTYRFWAGTSTLGGTYTVTTYICRLSVTLQARFCESVTYDPIFEYIEPDTMRSMIQKKIEGLPNNPKTKLNHHKVPPSSPALLLLNPSCSPTPAACVLPQSSGSL